MERAGKADAHRTKRRTNTLKEKGAPSTSLRTGAVKTDANSGLARTKKRRTMDCFVTFCIQRRLGKGFILAKVSSCQKVSSWALKVFRPTPTTPTATTTTTTTEEKTKKPCHPCLAHSFFTFFKHAACSLASATYPARTRRTKAFFLAFLSTFFFFFVFLVFSCCLLQARGGDPRSPQKAFLV